MGRPATTAAALQTDNALQDFKAPIFARARGLGPGSAENDPPFRALHCQFGADRGGAVRHEHTPPHYSDRLELKRHAVRLRNRRRDKHSAAHGTLVVNDEDHCGHFGQEPVDLERPVRRYPPKAADAVAGQNAV